MRWIAVDPRRDKAYISSNRGRATIWALDLAQLRQDWGGAFWRRIDPFYPLTRLVARCLRPLILLLQPDANAKKSTRTTEKIGNLNLATSFPRVTTESQKESRARCPSCLNDLVLVSNDAPLIFAYRPRFHYRITA
jgi:hypothetical protein